MSFLGEGEEIDRLPRVQVNQFNIWRRTSPHRALVNVLKSNTLSISSSGTGLPLTTVLSFKCPEVIYIESISNVLKLYGENRNTF